MKRVTWREGILALLRDQTWQYDSLVAQLSRAGNETLYAAFSRDGQADGLYITSRPDFDTLSVDDVMAVTFYADPYYLN